MAHVTAADAPLDQGESSPVPGFEDTQQVEPGQRSFASAGFPGSGKHKPRDPAAPHLPKPPRYSMEAIQLFTYWQKMDETNPDRLTAYIYRTWPVIDRRIENPKAYLYIAKESVAYANPKEWRSEMLHRYGSGNYKIILTDDALSKGIGQCLVTDLRDPEYPPVIESLDELVLDDPANQSFLENLRQKGILPGQEKDDDMATGAMTEALTGTIDKLTDKLTQRQKEPTPTQPTPSATDSAKEAVAMAREVFREGIELGKATTQAQADAQVAAASAGQQTPAQAMGLFKEVADVIRSIQISTAPPATVPGPGPADSLKEIAAIYNTVLERESKLHGVIMGMMESRVQGLEKLVQDRSVNPAAQTQAAPKDDLIASLEKLSNMKDKLQSLFGGAEKDEPEREDKIPMWMQLAQTALTGLPAIATSLLAMSYNMAVAKTGQGAPILPATPSPEISNPASAELAAGHQPQSQEQTPMNGAVYISMLKQIERPLLTHLNDPSKSGADFAAALMDFHGRIAYDAIRELGKDTIIALLSSYPPIASVINQIPERAGEFIEDFLNADAILAGDEEPEDEDDQSNPNPSSNSSSNPIPNTSSRLMGRPAGSGLAGPVIVDLPPVAQAQPQADGSTPPVGRKRGRSAGANS